MEHKERIDIFNDFRRQKLCISSFQQMHASLAQAHKFKVKSYKKIDFLKSLKEIIDSTSRRLPQSLQKRFSIIPPSFNKTTIKFIKQRNSSRIDRSADFIPFNIAKKNAFSGFKMPRNSLILNTSDLQINKPQTQSIQHKKRMGIRIHQKAQLNVSDVKIPNKKSKPSILKLPKI
jgi:hypothetical protein